MTEENVSTKKQKKRKVSRKDNPFAALDPTLNLKTRFEEIDDIASYAHTLPLEAKEWLNSYVEEEIITNGNHRGPKLNDFSDPKVRSRIYGNNNSRNRCVMTREKAQGVLNYLSEIEEKEENETDYETSVGTEYES